MHREAVHRFCKEIAKGSSRPTYPELAHELYASPVLVQELCNRIRKELLKECKL